MSVCLSVCLSVAQMVFYTAIPYILYINLQGYVDKSTFISLCIKFPIQWNT